MLNLNLNHKTIELVNSLRGKEKIRILFVCLGNICRSPAAEGVMRALVDAEGDMRFRIDSAGTGDYHTGDLPDHRMRIHARRRGYELSHRARQFRPSDFDDFDLVIVMDESNRRNVDALARTNDDRDKIVPMSVFVDRAMRYDHIPDPYYEGAEGFETVLDLLENGTRNLYDSLTTKKK